MLYRDITDADIDLFLSMFAGRMDVYSKRTVKKSTGEASYFAQCHNFWKNGCPRVRGSRIRCQDCENQAYKKLEREQIIAHLRGNAADATDVIGIYPLFPDNTCRFIVFDFDNHEKNAEKRDFSNTDDSWKEEADTVRKICQLNKIDALVERSRTGRGAHIWIFFEEPVEAWVARKFAAALLEKGAESVNLNSFRYYDRIAPSQNRLPAGGVGDLIVLPLQGQALRAGNSAFVDENWNPYPDQWSILSGVQKLTKEFIEEKIDEWTPENFQEEETNVIWKKEDVDNSLQITLSDGVYIAAENLQPGIQNKIRKLAAFANPVFYKNQAIGLSNFANSRYVYLGNDEDGHIKVPRGLLENITAECEKAGIPYHIEDERCKGQNINVEFNGELKESQVPAVEELLQHETGILNAATAFGKTVVCCNMIARKKVSTLILLQSSALMEQWKEALEKFLLINEEPPEYETPSGRKKKRDSVIGRLQGAHDSTTGIIDIAMAGSVCKKGEYHKRLKEYGLVIVDECHHAASDTIVDILQQVNAKYVYGVTATPLRGDGLEKINYMLLGPIRYRYTSKDRAVEQGIEHLVYPRFTKASAPRALQSKMHPNDAYELVRDNEDRDELILNDVKKCISEGRTPVVLSKYVDHSQRLYEKMSGCADKIFLLSGKNTKKAHKEILDQMAGVKPEETMILVATGQLVGEGFDFPRLDTLIMATPVAWKGVVEQYAGRLNRDYEGKKNVVVYDYIDSHITMFDRMYHKRLTAYKQIGYNISSENHAGGQGANAIFDGNTYKEIYKQDLLGANKEIIISSPTISGGKVYEITNLLMPKCMSGVKIIIVTWEPDYYGYGDSSYWRRLQDQMGRAGFEIKTVKEYCSHYCVVDGEIVWYGSMNFLGNEDPEDSLMRISDRQIAAKLHELTFEN